MTFKKRVAPALLAAAAVALAAIAQNAVAASGGGYGSSAAMPTIYSKNFWYSVAPSVVGSPPASAKITTVYYNYTYHYPLPAGLLVYLCDNTGTYCANVTSIGSGNVNFEGTGVKANTPVRFFSRVNGSGTMMPLAGGAVNVAVNYSY